ncbi:hypothetical protein HY634_04435 [Candidatus Uhrbacteria bacterium]|nr:hypothetical protein [Candidatus Uhrbacteria bacterium]
MHAIESVIEMVVYRIAFAPEHLYVGLGFIFGAGPGGFTSKDNEFLVTDEALKVLNDRRVPYEIVGSSDRRYRTKSAESGD